MACIRAGYTPVIAFWYFGDAISPEFVKNNKEAYWQTIQQQLIPLIRDLPEVVILLEPEFNKNGITKWNGWDAVASRAIALNRSGRTSPSTITLSFTWIPTMRPRTM